MVVQPDIHPELDFERRKEKNPVKLSYTSGFDIALKNLSDTLMEDLREILVYPTDEVLEKKFHEKIFYIEEYLNREFASLLHEDRQNTFSYLWENKRAMEDFFAYSMNHAHWKVEYSKDNETRFQFNNVEYFGLEKEAKEYIKYLDESSIQHSEPVELEGEVFEKEKSNL